VSEEFTFTGLFYLPDKPDRKVSGTLRCGANGDSVITLSGDFIDPYSEEITHTYMGVASRDDGIVYPLIVGERSEVLNPNRVTLYRCSFWGSQVGTGKSPHVIYAEYKPEFVFKGALFESPIDIQFKSFTVRYSLLNEWLDPVGIQMTYPAILPYEQEPDEIVISYKRQEPIIALISDEYRITFEIVPNTTWDRNRWVAGTQKDVALALVSYMTIEFQRPQPFAKALRLVAQVRDFLTLAIGQPAYSLAMSAKTEAHHTDPINYRPVEVVFRQVDDAATEDFAWPFEMYFSHRDIVARIGELLDNWIRKSDLLEPVTELYFGTVYNRNIFPHHLFLNLAQAVESYHRRTHTRTELPKLEHRKRLRAIRKSTPAEYRDWLSEKLAYSNELTLEHRITELVEKFKITLTKAIPDVDAFVELVVNARNYRTHFDERLKDKAAHGPNLTRVSAQLRLLLELCLLFELGFTVDEIDNMVMARRFRIGRWL
jgi:hypothetical protein